jgi:protease-4
MRRLVVLLFVAAIAIGVVFTLFPSSPRIPSAGVLVIELSGELEETPPLDPLSRMLAEGPSLPTILLQLEKAALDERVRGVLLHIRSLSIGYARIQELRDAVKGLRSHEKPVAALLDLATLNATREFYLASAAKQIYLVPGFAGPFAGIAGEYVFLGSMMEKAGVRLEYERVGAYKSAPEMFAESRMSPESRVMMNQLLDTLFEQVVRGIALSRGIPVDRVRTLIDEAPATATPYLRDGLADGVASRQEVVELLGGQDAEEIPYESYVGVDPRDLGLRTGPAVGLVFGNGPIVQSGGRRSLTRELFAADEVVEALRDAADHPDVRAIVLRVNSGGGSALASDAIWRQVRQIREKMPVVVSLADAAASGGYYVASAADAVIAEPATLTGSIGVFMLRPSLGGLYSKLGIHAEVMTRGKKAALVVTSQPLTPEQRELTRDLVQTLYAQFVDRVAEGRGMTPDEIDAAGQGRVWLGETAHTLGLIDEIGGLQAAAERAKREAGLEPDVDPRRLIFPGPRSVSEQVRDLIRGAFSLSAWTALDWLGLPKPLQGGLQIAPGEPAYLPTIWLEIR